MTNLVNHAANGGRIVALDDFMHAAPTEAANGLAHVIGAADEADHPLDLELAALGSDVFLGSAHALLSLPTAFSLAGLPLISSTVFERVSATCAASFKPSSAAKVALMTL